MIKATGLSKGYNRKTVLKSVCCSLENGSVYALVGCNGIGKSTLLNAITQPEAMDAGVVEIDGIDTRRFESKLHFFYLPDNKEMFLNLTGNEYLKLIARLYRQGEAGAAETLRKLSAAFKLEGPLNEYIGSYSLGMKQKVYLMAAFLSGVGNLILDEPFNGLDPEGAAALKGLLAACRDAGKLVLFSVHSLDLVANFCDDVVFIDRQRNVFRSKNPGDFKELEAEFFNRCV